MKLKRDGIAVGLNSLFLGSFPSRIEKKVREEEKEGHVGWIRKHLS